MKPENILHILAVAAVILLILFLISFNLIVRYKDKGFTELYFKDAPKRAGRELNFSFVVRNLENKDMSYQYSIYSNNKKINQGSLGLRHNQAKIIKKSLLLKKETEAKITVMLDTDQQIHFWIR